LHALKSLSQDSIIDTIRRTQVHFIHCVLPQNNAGLCDLKNALTPSSTKRDDIMMNIPLVRAQLRGSEVLEAIRIHRQGALPFLHVITQIPEFLKSDLQHYSHFLFNACLCLCCVLCCLCLCC
jgi:hypothetical protein